MSVTLELPADIEEAIARKAQRQGITAAEYMRRTLERAARPPRRTQTSKSQASESQKPKSGAELLADLKALNIPKGYGDPTIDSPELARQLAARFSRPNRETEQ